MVHASTHKGFNLLFLESNVKMIVKKLNKSLIKDRIEFKNNF